MKVKEEAKVLPSLQLAVEVELPGGIRGAPADLEAVSRHGDSVHVDLALLQGDETGEQPHEGALAAPVGTEEPDHSARRDLEVGPVERLGGPEAMLESVDGHASSTGGGG